MEVHCVLGGLTTSEVGYLRAIYRGQIGQWRTSLPPISPEEQLCEADTFPESATWYAGDIEPPGQQQQPVLRRSLPRGTTPSLAAIARKLERLAQPAAAAWAFDLRLNGTDDERVQFNRYIQGGFLPIHRDAFATPSWSIDPEEAVEWEPEHPDGPVNFTHVSRRLLSVVVQLTDHSAYRGGSLRFHLGTAEEPALAQRGADTNGHGNNIVNAVRTNSTILEAPRCAGDIIFFTGLVAHDVLPVESGHRETLAWWAHARFPTDTRGVWAGRSPWQNPSTGERWIVQSKNIIRAQDSAFASSEAERSVS